MDVFGSLPRTKSGNGCVDPLTRTKSGNGCV